MHLHTMAKYQFNVCPVFTAPFYDCSFIILPSSSHRPVLFMFIPLHLCFWHSFPLMLDIVIKFGCVGGGKTKSAPRLYCAFVGGVNRCQRLVNRSKTGTRYSPSVFVQQNFAPRQKLPPPSVFLSVSSPVGDHSLKTHKLISLWLFGACLYTHVYLLLCQGIHISVAKYYISMHF